jgi:hypothetical protein
MKALTLYAPWAMLMATNHKHIETRTWYTNYRGPVAIHSAKGLPNYILDLARDAPRTFGAIRERLGQQLGIYDLADLPRGYIVAIGELIACCKIPDRATIYPVSGGIIKSLRLPPYEPEFLFGDYTPGRYAWVFQNIRKVDPMVPALGKQGLWEWRDHNLPISKTHS